MAPREIEGALRASFDALKSEFGGIILGMGAIDVIRGDILDFTYNLPPNFLKYHGRIVNLMRKNPSVEFKGGKVRFGSYYLFETEDNSLFVVFNVASRFAFVVHVKLGTIQMGTVLQVMLTELRDVLSRNYDESRLQRMERIFNLR